jgi:hypothetical protein
MMTAGASREHDRRDVARKRDDRRLRGGWDPDGDKNEATDE